MAELLNLRGGQRLDRGATDYVQFRLEGLDRAKLKIKAVRARVRRALRILSGQFATRIKTGARTLVHVRTGALRRSISRRLARKAPRAYVVQRIHYGAFVELGTRKQRAQEHLRRVARPLRRPFQAAARDVIRASLRGGG